METTTIISDSFPLGEIVRLELGVVSPQPFQVQFVQVVTLQIEGGDYACPWGSHHFHLDFPVHDIEIGGVCWVIALFG